MFGYLAPSGAGLVLQRQAADAYVAPTGKGRPPARYVDGGQALLRVNEGLDEIATGTAPSVTWTETWSFITTPATGGSAGTAPAALWTETYSFITSPATGGGALQYFAFRDDPNNGVVFSNGDSAILKSGRLVLLI